jgi:N4-(beta-N-acetylglucosaminyl)-L-asparaginase
VSFYAVNKEGKLAGGLIYPGGKMAVHDGDSAKLITCEPLFDKAPHRS